MACAEKMLHVDAIQTATPGRMTTAAAGAGRRVVFQSSSSAAAAAALRSRFQVVLYYREDAVHGEGEALKVAAWIKESLSAALPEHPVLAGRLRREEQGGGWEMKLNDSGVRLVQATAEMSMAEVMEAEDDKHLAYWEDGDPEHSSLFCVQVTKFQGGGFSVGISCSLLLADPLFLSSFVKEWARTHAQMLSQGLLTQTPMFHLTYFQKRTNPHPIKSVELGSNSISSPSTPNTTLLFDVNGYPNVQSRSIVAIAYLRETTKILGVKRISKFTLVINDHSGDVKVESFSDTGITAPSILENNIKIIKWDQLGLNDITFIEKYKVFHTSYKIALDTFEECLVVIVVPKTSTNLLISVTVPKN